MIRFVCPLIVVGDVEASRAFYGGKLGLKVKYDFGQNVTFEGDFAIHERNHFMGLLGRGADESLTGAHNGELYFETDDVASEYARLESAGVVFLHGPREEPWCQRVMRCYDPDRHIVEIGETMESVVARLHGQGISAGDISSRTSMPPAFIESVLAGKRG